MYHLELYRGLSNESYPLLSTLGRCNYPINEIEEKERSIFEDFKREYDVSRYLQNKLPEVDEDLFFLSLGRHLGLNCRLMDWTANQEQAKFFASFNPTNRGINGAVWILRIPSGYFSNNLNYKLSPFYNSRDGTAQCRVIKMPFFTEDGSETSAQDDADTDPIFRRRRQHGYFLTTATEYINTPLEQIDLGELHLYKMLIPPKEKKFICQTKRPKASPNASPINVCEQINNKYLAQ